MVRLGYRDPSVAGRLIGVSPRFTGDYEGSAPEVKFIDVSENHTRLVSIGDYISGEPVTGATAVIPLSAFRFDPDFSADARRIKTLQFDAHYHSPRGKLQIDYIALRK